MEVIGPELNSMKIYDGKLNDYFEDFKKFILKYKLVSITAAADSYPSLDIEDVGNLVESLEKKLKLIIVSLYLEH